MESSRWNFIPLEKRHRRKEFDCSRGYRDPLGNDELNQYTRKYARQNDTKDISKAFVATQTETPLVIDGYYTISSSLIGFSSILEENKRQLPVYLIPAGGTAQCAIVCFADWEAKLP